MQHILDKELSSFSIYHDFWKAQSGAHTQQGNLKPMLNQSEERINATPIILKFIFPTVIGKILSYGGEMQIVNIKLILSSL